MGLSPPVPYGGPFSTLHQRQPPSAMGYIVQPLPMPLPSLPAGPVLQDPFVGLTPLQQPPVPEVIPQCSPPEVRALLEAMESFLDRGGCSMSFVNLQRNLKGIVPTLVDRVIPTFGNSWHRLIQGCPSLVVFHYTREDVERLRIGQIANEHEARIRFSVFSKEDSEEQDRQRAEQYPDRLSDLVAVCTEVVEQKGLVELTVLARVVAAKIAYFRGITKSSLKRILGRSSLWVSGKFVSARRTIDPKNRKSNDDKTDGPCTCLNDLRS